MGKNNRYYFETAPVGRAIAHFSVPTMTGMLVLILYNLVDTFFIGLLEDYNMLAGVALAMPLFTINMGIGVFFGTGCGSYISRLLGKKDSEGVRRTSAYAFYGCLAVGAIGTVAGFALLEPILKVLGASGETLAPTRQYASILIGGSIPCILSYAMGQIVRAEGAARASMTGSIIGTVSNIILDPICIFLLGWGVAGAAIATVGANCLAVGYYLHYQLRKSESLSVRPRDFTWDKEIFRATSAIGLPVFLLELIALATSLTLNNIAAGYGAVYVAIYGVIFKLGMLPKALSNGLCQGVQPLMGYTYAAKKADRLKETVRRTGLYGTGIATVFAVLLFAAGGHGLRLFNSDPAFLLAGVPLLRISLVSYLTLGVTFTATGLFQAVGKAGPSLAMSVVQGAVFIPLAWATSGLLGLQGFAWAWPAADAVAMLLGIALYVRHRRQIYAEATPAVQ
ncbi:MATE family efflux transporter [Ruminococcaceae bacterium OttesenSCG-928-L11]|nr:MATE family efflux transporter [Ruminococcaceae bacterium OttesenSCG-928-L11]